LSALERPPKLESFLGFNLRCLFWHIYHLDGSHKPVRRLTLAAKALDPADWFSIRLRAFRIVIHLAVG
jgi:hypothetical protein